MKVLDFALAAPTAFSKVACTALAACLALAACATPAGTGPGGGTPEGGSGGATNTSSSGGQGGSGGAGGEGGAAAVPVITQVGVHTDAEGFATLNVMCVVRRDQPACCWGSSLTGQLGSGENTASYWATPVAVLGDDAAEIHAGQMFTCGRTHAGHVYCWGDSYSGQLGLGDLGPKWDNVLVPKKLAGIEGAVGLTVGLGSCAWTDAGALFCWGSNQAGQLGLGTTGDAMLTPHQVPGLPKVVSAGTSGGATCALTGEGAVWCWGAGAAPTPSQMSTLGTDNAQLHVADTHRCVLKSGGGVWCWGGPFGQQPKALALPFGPVVQLGLGQHTTCALLEGGAVHCWGKNDAGQLGDGTQVDHMESASAVLVTDDAVRIWSGRASSCAWKKDGSVVCWGYLPMNIEESFAFTPPVSIPDDFACDGATVPPLSYEDGKTVCVFDCP